MKELWKDVPEYEGYYQVSDQGRVRSLDRSLKDWAGLERKVKGTMLSPKYSRSGRASFCISKYRYPRRYFTGGQMVAMTFLDHKPTKADYNLIMHKNGDYGDCRLSNIQVVTPEEFMETYQVSNSVKRRMLKNIDRKIEVSWWDSGEMIEGEMKCLGETYQLGLFKDEIGALKGCQKMLKRIVESIER